MSSTLREDISTLREDIGLTPGVVEVVEVELGSEWGDYGMDEWEQYDLPYVGPLDGAPVGLLDQEFNAGYGAPERPMWTVWTDTHVGFGTEYDGATGTGIVLRHPPLSPPGVTRLEGTDWDEMPLAERRDRES